MRYLLLPLLFAAVSDAQVPSVFGRMTPKFAMFIQEAEISWSTFSASAVSTSSFDVQAGDILVAYAGAETDAGITLSISGGSLTWTLQKSVAIGGGNWALAYIWTAVVDTDKTMTVSFGATSNTYMRGGNVLTFRNSSGVGASSKTNVDGTTPSLSLTTTKTNSVIVMFNADWHAVDGSTRSWRTGPGTFVETTYAYVNARYTFYGGYYPNSGGIAAYAVGMTAPTGQKYSTVAVEIKGP